MTSLGFFRAIRELETKLSDLGNLFRQSRDQNVHKDNEILELKSIVAKLTQNNNEMIALLTEKVAAKSTENQVRRKST